MSQASRAWFRSTWTPPCGSRRSEGPMAWLRPILLIAGAVFIGLLVWWERRRPRQAPELPGARTERSEPSLDLAATRELAQETRPRAERTAEEPSEAPAARDRELRRTPPV